MKTSSALKVLAGAAVMLLPLVASAESNYQTGASALTSTAHVDFQITIPKVLYLRVGSGSAYATGTLSTLGTIDVVNFAPSAAVVGNLSPVAGSGGDLTGGVETAAIISNSGNVTLNASATGAMSDGAAGDSIDYTQIATAAAANTAGYTLLTAPALANGTSTNVVLTAPATKVIKADAKWTYSYLNTLTPPAGTYGGTVANNGRVTYTATMP